MTSEGGGRSSRGDTEENIEPPSVQAALIYVPALSRGLDWMASEAPSPLNYSMILRGKEQGLPVYYFQHPLTLNLNCIFFCDQKRFKYVPLFLFLPFQRLNERYPKKPQFNA